MSPGTEGHVSVKAPTLIAHCWHWAMLSMLLLTTRWLFRHLPCFYSQLFVLFFPMPVLLLSAVHVTFCVLTCMIPETYSEHTNSTHSAAWCTCMCVGKNGQCWNRKWEPCALNIKFYRPKKKWLKVKVDLNQWPFSCDFETGKSGKSCFWQWNVLPCVITLVRWHHCC